jgi:methionyl-tRNA formyltransferase
MMSDRRLKILSSIPSDGSGVPGEVLGGTEIACGSGSITVLEMQISGRKAQSASVFLQGNNISQRLE